MVVAGFISSTDHWMGFTEAWNKKLNDYGLKYFRASECQNCKGEFKTWKCDDAKRIGLWWIYWDSLRPLHFENLDVASQWMIGSQKFHKLPRQNGGLMHMVFALCYVLNESRAGQKVSVLIHL